MSVWFTAVFLISRKMSSLLNVINKWMNKLWKIDFQSTLNVLICKHFKYITDLFLSQIKDLFSFLRYIFRWSFLPHSHFKNSLAGRARWLKPVIPALWDTKTGRSPEIRTSRLAWPIWRNPVSNKTTKLACNTTYSGGWGRRIPCTREAEVAVSWDLTIELQPGWQSKTPTQKIK